MRACRHSQDARCRRSLRLGGRCLPSARRPAAPKGGQFVNVGMMRVTSTSVPSQVGARESARRHLPWNQGHLVDCGSRDLAVRRLAKTPSPDPFPVSRVLPGKGSQVGEHSWKRSSTSNRSVCAPFPAGWVSRYRATEEPGLSCCDLASQSRPSSASRAPRVQPPQAFTALRTRRWIPSVPIGPSGCVLEARGREPWPPGAAMSLPCHVPARRRLRRRPAAENRGRGQVDVRRPAGDFGTMFFSIG